MDKPTTRRPFFNKLYSGFIAIAVGFLSIGQWSDTQAVIESAYHAFLTHFTHKVEYQQLATVKVGGNLAFVEQEFGLASVIKTAQKQPSLQYRFYIRPKYLLTIAVLGERIQAVAVMSRDRSFDPPLPFSSLQLSKFSFEYFGDFNGTFASDNSNLSYYIEGKERGREGLFLNQYVAYVDYGAQYPPANQTDQTLAAEQIRQGAQQKIQKLNQAILEDAEQDITDLIPILRKQLYPNVFISGHLDMETAADMLLTRYEYAAYFGE
ncbi:ETEC_3214 domain-containing protein [Gallaecimonas pentaromativorans]|uniref:ETEC_3214 domain-containing protein n=1 Tax=Gallaecimonas pentaromativorans TaxID=584787 RepID=UPI0012EDC8D8|nr:ETEC_3214 domain-containing protein [Gallaecimonas pentaromativorans]